MSNGAYRFNSPNRQIPINWPSFEESPNHTTGLKRFFANTVMATEGAGRA